MPAARLRGDSPSLDLAVERSAHKRGRLLENRIYPFLTEHVRDIAAGTNAENGSDPLLWWCPLSEDRGCGLVSRDWKLGESGEGGQARQGRCRRAIGALADLAAIIIFEDIGEIYDCFSFSSHLFFDTSVEPR